MIQLLIVANNRPDYLIRVRDSLREHLPQDLQLTCWIQNDDKHQGMAANIQAGWSAVLQYDWDYLLHWEDDMVLLRPPPLDAMIEALETHPQVANLMLKRQPWNSIEEEAGDVVRAIQMLAPNSFDMGRWVMHDHIFSLNPCLIPRHIVEKGWPAGNEAQMTADLLSEGWMFGAWNDPEPYLDHIGVERGPGWKL